MYLMTFPGRQVSTGAGCRQTIYPRLRFPFVLALVCLAGGFRVRLSGFGAGSSELEDTSSHSHLTQIQRRTFADYRSEFSAHLLPRQHFHETSRSGSRRDDKTEILRTILSIMT